MIWKVITGEKKYEIFRGKYRKEGKEINYTAYIKTKIKIC